MGEMLMLLDDDLVALVHLAQAHPALPQFTPVAFVAAALGRDRRVIIRKCMSRRGR